MNRTLARCVLAAALVAALPLAAAAQEPMSKDKMGEMMKMDAMKKDAMGMALAKGAFSGADGHKASGSYQILGTDGKRVLETSADLLVDPNAPDVYVVLSNSAKVGKDNAIWLGKLKSNSGTHSFAIPADAKVDKLTMVVLWCKQYSATIGVAPFDPSGLMKGAMDKMHNMDRKPEGGR